MIARLVHSSMKTTPMKAEAMITSNQGLSCWLWEKQRNSNWQRILCRQEVKVFHFRLDLLLSRKLISRYLIRRRSLIFLLVGTTFWIGHLRTIRLTTLLKTKKKEVTLRKEGNHMCQRHQFFKVWDFHQSPNSRKWKTPDRIFSKCTTVNLTEAYHFSKVVLFSILHTS